MVCLDERLARLQDSLTLIPTRTRVSHGGQIHCGFTWRTLRSIFLVCISMDLGVVYDIEQNLLQNKLFMYCTHKSTNTEPEMGHH